MKKNKNRVYSKIEIILMSIVAAGWLGILTFSAVVIAVVSRIKPY